MESIKACRKKKIKAIVLKQISREDSSLVAIIENVQRDDLNALEEAEAYIRLIELHKISHEKIAKKTGKSRSYISNLIRLLHLKPKVKSLLGKGIISYGHARALLGAENQEAIANKIVKEKLSVRDVEFLIKNSNIKKNSLKKAIKPKDPNIEDYEKYLSLKLGYKVEIKDRKGKGYLLVKYKNLEQLDSIVELFNK